MDLTVRRRLRALAWLAFLVLVPVLIAYARGYRFSFSFPTGRPGGQAVGALIVRTVPRGAAVAVDGRIVDERSPTGVGSLPVGTHAIRIEKAGYRPLEKRLAVVAGKVTDLLHVRLLPATIDEQRIRSGVRDVWASPGAQWFLIREAGLFRLATGRELTAATETAAPPAPLDSARGKPLDSARGKPLDSARGKPLDSARGKPLGRRLTLPIRRTDDLEAHWSPSGATLAVGIRRDGTHPEAGALVDLRSARVERLPQRLALIGWTQAGPELLVTLSPEGLLMGFRAGERVTMAEGVVSAGMHPEGVLLQRRTANGTPLTILVRELGAREPLRVPLAVTVTDFAASPRGSIAAVAAESGALLVLPVGADRWERYGSGVRNVQWSPDGDKLAYQESNFDLWVLNVIEDRSALPPGVPQLVVRLSSPLHRIRWFPDSQRLLFMERDIVALADIDPRGGHWVEHLASTNRGETNLVPLRDGDELMLSARRDERETLVRFFLKTPSDR